jgi:hypothetical protein
LTAQGIFKSCVDCAIFGNLHQCFGGFQRNDLSSECASLYRPLDQIVPGGSYSLETFTAECSRVRLTTKPQLHLVPFPSHSQTLNAYKKFLLPTCLSTSFMHLSAEWKCSESERGDYVHHPGTGCQDCVKFVAHHDKAKNEDPSFQTASLERRRAIS